MLVSRCNHFLKLRIAFFERNSMLLIRKGSSVLLNLGICTFAALNPKQWVNFTLQESHPLTHNTRIYRFFAYLIHDFFLYLILEFTPSLWVLISFSGLRVYAIVCQFSNMYINLCCLWTFNSEIWNMWSIGSSWFQAGLHLIQMQS
jgi:hypothetical protein